VTSASLAFVLRAVSLMPVQQSHPNGVAWRGVVPLHRKGVSSTVPSFHLSLARWWTAGWSFLKHS
jgi:hypothetical protein